jgi:hypothetical protein
MMSLSIDHIPSGELKLSSETNKPEIESDIEQ